MGNKLLDKVVGVLGDLLAKNPLFVKQSVVDTQKQQTFFERRKKAYFIIQYFKGHEEWLSIDAPYPEPNELQGFLHKQEQVIAFYPVAYKGTDFTFDLEDPRDESMYTLTTTILEYKYSTPNAILANEEIDALYDFITSQNGSSADVIQSAKAEGYFTILEDYWADHD